MLTTNQKGAIAEAAIVYEAIKLGIGVLKPVDDGSATTSSSTSTTA